MAKNSTIIGDITRRTNIYRVFPRNRFFELFDEQKNALVRPTMWEDPFENFILRSPVRTAAGETGKFPFHEDVYGQCWTLKKRSDAMWRIYSPKTDAIRVRTTVGKLIDSLCAASESVTNDSCFIGRVDYPPDIKLKEFARTVFKDGITAGAVARSLLKKRDAFEHEAEVRLIYFEGQNRKHEGGVYKYALDPHAVFDQFMIDPRMCYKKFCKFKDEILARTNIDEACVKRSLLYKPPEGYLVEVP